jgi:hypothetical protein
MLTSVFARIGSDETGGLGVQSMKPERSAGVRNAGSPGDATTLETPGG